MKTQFKIMLFIIVLLAACKGKNKQTYDFVNNNANADSSKIDSMSLAQPKLIKKAAMQFKVKNVEETSKKITNLTGNYNGIVLQHDMNSVAERSNDINIGSDSVLRIVSLNTNATLVVKVPVERLDEFLDEVAKMGLYVNSRILNVTDKSLDYKSTGLKLANRMELVKQQKTGKIVIKDPNNVLLLKDDMVDAEINNLEINESAKNAIVNLSLYQSNTIAREIIVNDDPHTYNLPFYRRVLLAFQNGWFMFSDFVIALINMWVLLLLVIAAFWVHKIFKLRNIKQVTVSPQQ